jgi:hypothetical protein
METNGNSPANQPQISVSASSLEPLKRAVSGQSFSNFPAIFSGFAAKGIPESEIKPRENVFTFQAWKALGRVVRRGEHGVKIATFIESKSKDIDKDTGERRVNSASLDNNRVSHLADGCTQARRPMTIPLTFPQSLTEKYRPHAISEFAGLEKPKRILSKFAANPYPSAWLFVGPPGLGKTSMALALAETLSAELHHIPSQQCLVANVEDVIRQCWYVPVSGGFPPCACR